MLPKHEQTWGCVQDHGQPTNSHNFFKECLSLFKHLLIANDLLARDVTSWNPPLIHDEILATLISSAGNQSSCAFMKAIAMPSPEVIISEHSSASSTSYILHQLPRLREHVEKEV